MSTSTTLFSPIQSAYPKFAGLLDAVANIIAAETVGPDLGPLLANATAGQRIELTPGAAYVLTGTPAVKANGVALIGFGNSVAITPAAGASSGIIVQGDGCTFAGLNFSGPAGTVALRLYGIDPQHRPNAAQPIGTSISDCAFADGMETGILLDAWADNVRVVRCTFGTLGAEAVYCTADNLQVTHCTCAGSLGEHCVRFDANASTLHRPANATLFGCDLANHNTQGKECLTAREMDGLSVIGCTFDGWVSAGQAPDDGVWHARNLVFFGCTWRTLRPGGALGEFKHDCTVTIDSCSCPASATEPAFTLDARGKLTAANNTLQAAPNIVPRALAIVDSTASLIESGTVTTNIL
jgi:hypothetical protein